MGGRDQSQVKIKFKKFEKVKSVPKTYQKVITMTDISNASFFDLYFFSTLPIYRLQSNILSLVYGCVISKAGEGRHRTTHKHIVEGVLLCNSATFSIRRDWIRSFM